MKINMLNRFSLPIIIMLFLGINTISAQTSPLSNGLVAYWNFDKVINNQYIDSVNSRNWTINNGNYASLAGVINNGTELYLGGYLENSYSSYFGNVFSADNSTVNFWVKNNGLYASILTLSTGNLPKPLDIYMTSQYISYNWGDGSGYNALDSPTFSNNGVWHMFSFTKQNNNYTIYLDGVPVVSTISGIYLASGGTMRFGLRGDGFAPSANATYDELGIWDRALSSNEIGLLYNQTSVSLLPASPPVLSPIGPLNISENQTLTIQLQATDINNDTITFLTNAQTQLPGQSFLNSNTGQFTWTPSFYDQGDYNVTFYVTDGQFIDLETVTIHVIDTSLATLTLNNAPIIGTTITFNLSDPLSPNRQYLFGMALGTIPGISLSDGRIIPLNNDWLFNSILYVPQLFGFSGTTGTLDSQGNGQVTWSIPSSLNGAQGYTVYTSFATLNYSAIGDQAVTSIAPAVSVTLQ